MATLVSERTDQPWLRRLYLPSYQIAEAAKYADISPQTVAAWHRLEKHFLEKEDKAALSYMQLIEVAVVAAFRKMGVPLKNIRATRDYAKHHLKSEYPFATFRFKEGAKHLYLDSHELEDVAPGSVVQTDQGGQLAWEIVIGRLREFDYEKEHEGLALKWHVAGRSSPIIIDPRIAFGAPAVKGTPTWIIRGRWDAGESYSDIAEDFGIVSTDVKEALKFEGVVPGGRRKSLVH
ncbi:DUF433 domain-containing protein [Bradyrhizobium sp.]|uniref:DUF433 domain-containing protein n=1 Tax=Bradyrhizobium sp. TaxID=376 RepID=UPI003C1A56C3